jgi:hypothetical protein
MTTLKFEILTKFGSGRVSFNDKEVYPIVVPEKENPTQTPMYYSNIKVSNCEIYLSKQYSLHSRVLLRQ